MSICAGLALTGCFYLDPINLKPELYPIDCKIGNRGEVTCPEHVRRGDLLSLSVMFDDPDGPEDKVKFDWKAFRCTAADGRSCEPNPSTMSSSPSIDIEVPTEMPSRSSIRVELEIRDELGASAEVFSPYPINDPPSLDVVPSAHSLVVGAPIELRATYGDPDDGPGPLTVRWDVVAPDPTTATLEDLPVLPTATDPPSITEHKLLVPDRVGAWDIEVTARDSMNEIVEKHATFTIGADQPPCLAQVTPAVPPADTHVPIHEPTLFQVVLVEDELDAYPRLSSDLHFGTTAFEWSILPPGSPGWQALVGATGNTVDFDPSAFTPGEIVELRVEIFDRNAAAIPCAADAATCSINDQPACVQRQTWRVEVR